ncbi:hypothetical protein QTP86_007828 [Hemibagrus guttatus]|nr:hypothetical protein QTP86_007828 [Hemibagrus guttatus]
MKKTRNLRRAWPGPDGPDLGSDRDKDYRLHKHFPPSLPPLAPYIAQGDVSPISMSPISQSQFIPLGEILCLAISAMNSARKPVTQDALMEHLNTCFPAQFGVTPPPIGSAHHDVKVKL